MFKKLMEVIIVVTMFFWMSAAIVILGHLWHLFLLKDASSTLFHMRVLMILSSYIILIVGFVPGFVVYKTYRE